MSHLLEKAISVIEAHEILPVFPSTQKKSQEENLWKCLFPRTPFVWDWTDEGVHPSVLKLWHLKNALARSKKVLYGRFLGARPVFLSLKKADELISRLPYPQLSKNARLVLGYLEDNSPLSKKQIAKILRHEGEWVTVSDLDKILRELQKHFLICTLGESTKESGPMPSSEYAAISLVFPFLKRRDEIRKK